VESYSTVVNRLWTSPYHFLGPMRRFFRSRRFRDFNERYATCRTIVDIGGDHTLWDLIGRKKGVTVVNVWVPEERGSLPYVLGDGCRLPFGDRSIDLAFSNSAIEHVGDFEKQSEFAAEMLRVGEKIYCQTPCRAFPVDPHLSAFFLHWLPRRWLTPAVLRYFTFNGWLSGRPYVYDVTWLSKSQLREIFPGCVIKTERFFGLPKAFIVTS
jgi:SAM-dependent methyltransferase